MGSKYKGVKVPEPVLKQRRASDSRHSLNSSRKSEAKSAKEAEKSLQKVPKSLKKENYRESDPYTVIQTAYKEAKLKNRLST